jgi:tetratricopeptide (TPR) repeat protein
MRFSILVSLILAISPAFALDSITDQQKMDQIRLKSAIWMKLIRESDDFAKKKDWTQAESRIQQVLSDREKFGLDLASERSSLARLYAKAGQKDKADRMFQLVISQRETAYGDDDFTLVYPLNEYADYLTTTGRAAQAKALKKRAAAIEADSQKPPVKKMAAITGDIKLTKEQKSDKLVALGKQFFERDNALKARYALDQAIAQNPKNAEAYIARAQAFMQLEELQKSLADLNKGLALDPKNAAGLADRGGLYQSLEKPQLALRDFSASIALRPDPDTLGYRAKQFDASGQSSKAIADYSTVLKIAPQTRWALVQRAIIYSRLGNYPLAIADLDRIVALTPDNSDSYELRAETLLKAKKPQEALKDATKLIALTPDYTTGYELRAKIYKVIEGKNSAHAAADVKAIDKLKAAASARRQ